MLLIAYSANYIHLMNHIQIFKWWAAEKMLLTHCWVGGVVQSRKETGLHPLPCSLTFSYLPPVFSPSLLLSFFLKLLIDDDLSALPESWDKMMSKISTVLPFWSLETMEKSNCQLQFNRLDSLIGK